MLARAGERLADEDASHASAQATPSTAHQSSCDEAPVEGTTLANQTIEPGEAGACQRPTPSPHSVTGDSLEVPASGDSEPPTSDGLVESAPSPIRAKTDANAVARTIMQRQHHLTAAERDEVAQLYQDGLPVRTICERFGISKDVVYGIRRRRGLPRRRAGMTDEQKAQAVELHGTGVSAARSAGSLVSTSKRCWPTCVQQIATRLASKHHFASHSARPAPLTPPQPQPCTVPTLSLADEHSLG